MATWSLDTLRQAARTPALWVLIGVSVLAGWFGLELGILVVGTSVERTQDLVVGTSQIAAVVTVLLVLAGLLDLDQEPGLADAAALAAPGPRGRLLGRWAGASLAGALVLVGVELGLMAVHRDAREAGVLWLQTATVVLPAQIGAWGLLLARLAPGGGVVLGGALLWVLGHAPWTGVGISHAGTAGFLETLLPGPMTDLTDPRALAARVVAVAALLCLALAAAPRPGARRAA